MYGGWLSAPYVCMLHIEDQVNEARRGAPLMGIERSERVKEWETR